MTTATVLSTTKGYQINNESDTDLAWGDLPNPSSFEITKASRKKIKGTIIYIYPFSSFFIFDGDVCVLTKRILLLFSRVR